MDTSSILPLVMMATAVVAFAHYRTPARRARSAQRYVRRLGLPPTPAAASELDRRTAAREQGGAVAVALGSALLFAVSLSNPSVQESPAWFMYLMTPVVAGPPVALAVAALTEAVRPSGDGPRLARTDVPEVGDYVPRLEVSGARIAAVAALLSPLALVALAVVAPGVSVDAVPVTGLAFVVASLVLLTATEVVARRVVDRPQPAHSPQDLVWSDALRALTLRQLYGGPAALAVWGAVLVVTAPGYSGRMPNWLVGTVGVSCLVMLAAAVVLAALTAGRAPAQHFLRRLWADGVPGAPGRPTAAGV